MSPVVPIPLNSIIPSFEAILQTPRERSFYIWTYGTWAVALGVRNEGSFYVDVHGSGQAPKEGALYAQLRFRRDALLRVMIPDVKRRSMENCYLNLHIITVPTTVTVSTVEARVFQNQDSSVIREKWNAALELSILDNSPIRSWHVIASPQHVASFLADQNISVVNRACVDTTNFMNASLYSHLRRTFQSVVHSISWLQQHCPDGKFYMCLLGSQVVEEVFCLLRMLEHNKSFDILQLQDRLRSLRAIQGVFEDHVNWKRHKKRYASDRLRPH